MDRTRFLLSRNNLESKGTLLSAVKNEMIWNFHTELDICSDSAWRTCWTKMRETFFISGDWVESPYSARTGIDNNFKMADTSCRWWNPVNDFCVSCCLSLSVSKNRSYRYQGMSERRAIAERSPSSQDSSITGFIRYEHLVAGISGGVTSTLILHPLDLIKIRFQGKMISHNNCK